MRRLLIFLFALASVVGCAAAGVEITRRNNHVETASYSFVAPADDDWRLQRDDAKDYILLTRRIGPFEWRMLFYKNVLLPDNPLGSAKAIADNFRNGEVWMMMEEGVKKGKYQLRDVKMGEENVAGKTFYTMEHVAFNTSIVQRGSMFLFFPQPENNRYFFAAHYFETTPPNGIAKSAKDDFYAALASFTLK